MALSAAEKPRLYREKRDANSERRAEYLKKEKERWEKRKASGKIKLVAELSEREQRKIRRMWRLNRASNRKQKQKKLIETLGNIGTPPHSPNEVADIDREQQAAKYRKRRRKTQKKIHDVTAQLENQIRQTEKYKKRWHRLLNQSKKPETPRSKAMRLLSHATPHTLRKTLIFHNVLGSFHNYGTLWCSQGCIFDKNKIFYR